MGRAGAAKHSRPPRQTGSGCRCNRGGRTERCVGGDAVRGGRLAVHQIPNSASGREAKPVLKRGGCGAGDARAACQSQSASKICASAQIPVSGGVETRAHKFRKLCGWAQRAACANAEVLRAGAEARFSRCMGTNLREKSNFKGAQDMFVCQKSVFRC